MMTLTLRPAPKSDLDILLKTLGSIDLADSLAGGTGFFEVSQPVPVYTMSLEAAAGDVDPASAVQTVWRYLLTDDGEAAIADLDLAGPGGSPPDAGGFNNLTRGRLADTFMRALEAAGRIAASTAADYELRVLEVPGVNMGSVWLHRQGASVFIPYLDAARLRGVPPRKDDGFLAELKRRAILQIEESRARASGPAGNAGDAR